MRRHHDGEASGIVLSAACFGELAAADGQIRVTAWSLPRESAVRRARGLLRFALEGHVTDPAILEDLDVVVCELATNSFRHTQGSCEMRILRHAGVPVVCEIADVIDGLDCIAQRLNRQQPFDLDLIPAIDSVAEDGRGLGIVAALTAGRCGTHATRLCGTGQTGKSVWFTIPHGREPD